MLDTSSTPTGTPPGDLSAAVPAPPTAQVPAPPTAEVPAGVLAPSLRATTVGVVVVVTLFAFEALAVATALPTAARDLGGLSWYGWAFTGFLLANVVGMVLGGGLADRAGPRAPLVAGLLGFVGGLAVAGTAPTMGVLVLGRVLQGLAGGAVITALYVLVGRVYPHALQPRVVAAMSTAWVVPSLVGPVVAGTVAQHAGWRWVFLGLVPLVALGTALLVPSLRRLSLPAPGASAPLGPRVLRAVVAAAGTGLLQLAGQRLSPASVPLALAGAVALGWALVGLLPPRAFRLPAGVGTPVVLRGLMAGAFFGVESLVPLSLQEQHGLSPVAAGVPLTVGAVSWAAGSWVVGRARFDAAGRARLVRAGFASIALAAAVMALVAQPGTPVALAYAGWLFGGLGAGLGISGGSVLLLRWTTEADRGRDSAALQLTDAVGAALAAGFSGVLVALAVRGVVSRGVGFAVADLAMCAVAVGGALAAARLRPPA